MDQALVKVPTADVHALEPPFKPNAAYFNLYLTTTSSYGQGESLVHDLVSHPPIP